MAATKKFKSSFEVFSVQENLFPRVAGMKTAICVKQRCFIVMMFELTILFLPLAQLILSRMLL